MKNLCHVASRLAVLVVGLLVVTGCARKPKIDLSALRNAPPGSADVAGATFLPDSFPGGSDIGAPGSGDGWGSMDSSMASAGGAGSITPTQERWAAVVVYFAYDSAAIGPAERPKLETLASHLKEHADYAVVVEGHCDERGSDEYNRALGETRALVVRDYLVTLGVGQERIETVSYGEEKPVAPGATSESEHQQNRRAEFVIGTRR